MPKSLLAICLLTKVNAWALLQAYWCENDHDIRNRNIVSVCNAKYHLAKPEYMVYRYCLPSLTCGSSSSIKSSIASIALSAREGKFR